MSLRPRFGDGGVLRRPVGLTIGWLDDPREEWEGGQVITDLAEDRDWDPFERTPAGLLLAEDFARAELDDFDAAASWYLEHGVLDLRGFLPAESFWQPERHDEPPSDTVYDGREDIAAQQRLVVWILLALARLSQAPETWDPRWMEVVLKGGGEGGGLWLDPGEGGYLEFRGGEEAPQQVRDDWLWVPRSQWEYGWRELEDGSEWDAEDHSVLPLGRSRDGLIELVRRLIEPNARRAAQFQVDVLWLRTDLPVVVRERRRWRSILAPIYLQLLEGLRRVSEGQRGAAFCRECGLPFLSLDARRSSFCNDRDRFRFSQRERRKRVDMERAAHDAVAISDAATIHIERAPREGGSEP